MSKKKAEIYQRFIKKILIKLRRVINQTDVTIKYEEKTPKSGTIVIAIEKLNIYHCIPVDYIAMEEFGDLEQLCYEYAVELMISRRIAEDGTLADEHFLERNQEQLFISAVNYYDNRLSLEGRIFEQVLDIALVPYLEKKVFEDIVVEIQLPEKVMEISGKSRKELISLALENASNRNPARAYCLCLDTGNDYLKSLDDEAYCRKMMGSGTGLILTTEAVMNGATGLFYPGVLEHLAAVAGDKTLYITFPSDHEAVIHDALDHACNFSPQIFNLLTKGNMYDTYRNRPSQSLFCFDAGQYTAQAEVRRAYEKLYLYIE